MRCDRRERPHHFPIAPVPMKTSDEIARRRRHLLLAFLAGSLLAVPLTIAALTLADHLREGTAEPFPDSMFEQQQQPSMPASTRSRTDWVDGVFWTNVSESLVPGGFSDADDARWHAFLNASRIARLEEGCGRMQNRLLVFADERRACARYRFNLDQMQGDLFSFYLGRLLGLRNLPPTALAVPDLRDGRWSSVSSSLARARWTARRPALLTRFVDDLQPAFVPASLRRAKGARTLRPGDLANATAAEIPELVQWSDLIVFDYLTANLDRVINNLFNERWDAQMMSRPAHNLARTPGGLLLFLDNESGLLHGYRLLGKYQPLHRALLDALCLFRHRTVRALHELRARGVRGALEEAFGRRDPGMQDVLPLLPHANVRILEERMDDVLRQVRTCQATDDTT